MEVAQYTDNLDKLLSKDAINESDALLFVKSLIRLSDKVKVEESFHTFGPIVQQWMRAYKPIFVNKQIDDSAKICIRKSGKVLTYAFLSLMQSFGKYEIGHNLEFYGQWRHIMSEINPRKLAEYALLYGQQFKGLIENLRTSTNRCDQLSVLAVLLLYTEQLSPEKLSQLKENSNSYILDKLPALNKNPRLLMNQHSFLRDIDAMGQSIISLNPTKIICDDISLNLNTSDHALWIDFNMIETSITLVAVSPAQNVTTFFATLARSKLIERLSAEHELKIRGSWSVMYGPGGAFSKRTTMNVYLPIHDRNAVWKAKVKSLFHFKSDTPTLTQSISSQGSMTVDRRLAQFANLDDRRYGTGTSRNNQSFTSYSMSGSHFQQNSVAPIAKTQLDADKISLFAALPPEQEIFTDPIRDPLIDSRNDSQRGLIAHTQLDADKISLFTAVPIEQEIFTDPIRDPQRGPIGHTRMEDGKVSLFTAVPIEQETFTDPIRDPQRGPIGHTRLEDGKVSLFTAVPIEQKTFTDQLEGPLDDQYSDQSSGISLDNDMSVMDDVESESGSKVQRENDSVDQRENDSVDQREKGSVDQRENGSVDQRENGSVDQRKNENFETFSTCFHGSFSSASSSLSQINEQVKKFIEGTQNKSGQPTPQQNIIDNVPTATADNIIGALSDNSTAARTTSLSTPKENLFEKPNSVVRDIIGTPIDNPIVERTKYVSPPKESLLRKQNSLIRSSSLMSSRGAEPVNKVKALVAPSVRCSESLFDLLKSSKMFRYEEMKDEVRVLHEPLADDVLMADDKNDEANDIRTTASVNPQSNVDLDESDVELEFDDEGMVFDRHGCLFVNADEVEDAWYVYMENNGLEYLKSEAFKAADPKRRQRTEREFRALHKIISQQIEDGTYIPSGSIGNALSGTANRKLLSNSDEGSLHSHRSDVSLQPTIKHKNSEASLGNESNTDVVTVSNVDNNQRLEGVSSAPPRPDEVIGYLKDFFETRETCEAHRVKLLQLITEMQANNILALSGKEPPATTMANMRQMCKEAREYASMIVHKAYKQ